MFDVKTEKSEMKHKSNSKKIWKPMQNTLDDALKVSSPSWPLQNTVAVNPFWFRRSEKFEDVVVGLSKVIHHGVYMPLDYYADRYSKGDISENAVRSSLERLRKKDTHLPEDLEEFLTRSHHDAISRQKFQSLSDFLDERMGISVSKTLSNETAKYAAAYLDSKQALAGFPWRDQGFLAGWFEASKYDQSIQVQGLKPLNQSLVKISSRKAADVIKEIFEHLDISDAHCQLLLLQRLAVSVLGWMSQFRYVEWQKGLGYATNSGAEAADLLAVRLIYEFALYDSYKSVAGDALERWKSQALNFSSDLMSTASHVPLEIVWQNAFEESYQIRLARSINTTNEVANNSVDAQIAFCIDVRSEMIRRNIEAADPRISTIGFAGFFGIAMDYKKIDEHEAGHRCPVLLTPAVTVHESAKGNRVGDISSKVTRKLTLSYFKALRKAPMSSFAYVEMLGILALRPMLSKTWRSVFGSMSSFKVPGRFRSEKYVPDISSCSVADGAPLGVAERSTRAAGILKHMGLRSGFAPVVVIAGHGSHTTNNAFGSALDCGACGGHAGDINARVLVDLLNDQSVRSGLKEHGINLPDETLFVAAVHETVTDEVYFLDSDSLPTRHQAIIRRLKSSLRAASDSTRLERQTSRSRFMISNPRERSLNWSEVRPEWGLAGNACFVVAPRSRTKGVNLGSRSFLHDYDYSKDDGYQTLELIMTAPMVVTNWINLQYFASTVAPEIYGAGNKVIHNLVNESGVLEGNGGDLRVGLPLQSVHDGSQFVHEPLRLSVVIEAPREALEAIIAKHTTVRELVDNEWLYLMQINREENTIYVRRPGGEYVMVTE